MKAFSILFFLLPLQILFSLPEGVAIVDGVAKIPGERIFGSREFREMQQEAHRYPSRKVLYETRHGKIIISGNYVEIIPYGTRMHAALLNNFALDTAKGLYWEELEMLDLPASPYRSKIRVYVAEVFDHESSPNEFGIPSVDETRNYSGNNDPFAAPTLPPSVKGASLATQSTENEWKIVSEPSGTQFVEHILLGPAGFGSFVISPVKGLCMCHEVYSVRVLDSDGKVIQHLPELLSGDVAVCIKGSPNEDVSEILLRSDAHGNVSVYSILIIYQPDEGGNSE